MGWYDEAEQGLPPQRHREPITLRQEILDELTDHLTLAAERESESGSEDDQQIRTRVLKKFGNPAAIARALWWDAMKETIMKDWIQISINAAICIAVIGFMALFYRQMQTTNTALINALNDRPSAAEELYPSVEFILHRGSIDGPLAEGVQVGLFGKAFNEESTFITEVSDTLGQTKFGPIRAGRYRATFTDEKTGLRRDKQITLYSGDGTQTVHVPVPPTTQVPLDVTAPSAQHFTDKDFGIVMSMRAAWSHEDDHWWANQPKTVIVTSDGIFLAQVSQNETQVSIPPRGTARAQRYRVTSEGIQLEEPITHTYGNRVSFSQMGIVQTLSGGESFRRLKDDRYSPLYENDFIPHDLQPDGPNTIVLDLPDALLDAYKYHVRLSANKNHGLPGRFAWFPERVSEEFTNFVIDEARLVEQSLGFVWTDDGYALYPGVHPGLTRGQDSVIMGQDGHIFSLKNAPKSLPENYKLLFAFQISISPRFMNELDLNLCAYLDTSPASYGLEERVEYVQPHQTLDLVWKLDAKSIGKVLFVDLTDAINDDPDFENASGILLKWETPSKNELYFTAPERAADHEQPVWLIMKPIANDSPSNPNAD